MFDIPKGFGDALGTIIKRAMYAPWEGAQSPYGLPIPIVYGVSWVTPIQVYSGEQFTWYSGDSGGAAAMVVPVYSVDDATGAVSIEEKGQTCQSAVLVLCESATTILDILKDGVSINTGMLDNTPITTVTQRLRMISGRVPNPDGIIPPTGEEHGYFWPGLPGTAPAHTRFSRAANLGAAPYTYSTVARCDFCALGIGGLGQRPSLKFKVQGELAASATVGAHPADVLLDLWALAGKPALLADGITPALDVETYYRDFVNIGGGSGSTAWTVNRTIDTQTSARELMQSLLDETFATVVKKETGALVVRARHLPETSSPTALGVNDFVVGGGPLITVEMKQASDIFNCYPVTFEVTTASGTHQVTNEDTTWAVGTAPTFADAHPFSATEPIRRAPPVRATWISTAEHALNLSYLLARESYTIRATYKFRLHKRWVLLQEHDLLSLTEPHLGVTNKLVKISRIAEVASGVIEVEAEEWFAVDAYTTPPVAPTDGLDATAGGTPTDPTTSTVDAIVASGILSRAVKGAFFAIVQGIWQAYLARLTDSMAAAWGAVPTAEAAALVGRFDDFDAYLTTIGFDVDWTWEPGEITDPTALAAWRAAQAAWLSVDTPVVATDFRDAFAAVNAALRDLHGRLADTDIALGVLGAPGGTTTFLRGDGTWTEPQGAAQAYDLIVFSRGVPGDAEVMWRWIIAHDIAFPANFAGSIATVGVVPTAITVFTVKKNGVDVGTITFPASGLSAAFSCTAWTVTLGDVVTVENQATADATIALISITLAGVRTA